MKANKIIILIFFALFLSGCLPGSKPEEPEILMGRDCGLDHFPCCNEEPSCSYSQQCCADPSGSGENYCADSCECGAEGDFCCEGGSCNDGLACHLGRCRSCGALDEPCCGEGECHENNSACHKDICVECGLTGNPCCGSEKECEHQDDTTQDHTECVNGICVKCGAGGAQVCESSGICLPGNLLNNKHCLLCGGLNQPCCQEEIDGYRCRGDEIGCKLGFCSPME